MNDAGATIISVNLFHWITAMGNFRFLAFRADPLTGAAIKAAADAANLSLSGWLRNAARRCLPSQIDLPALPPSPRRRPVRIPDADLASIARLTAAVSRLNGAIVQLSKALRETGHGPDHIAMESILGDIRDLKSYGAQLFRRLSR